MGDFFARRGNGKRRLINEEDEFEGGERGVGGDDVSVWWERKEED